MFIEARYEIDQLIPDLPPMDPECYHTDIFGQFVFFDENEEEQPLAKVHWIRIDVDLAMNDQLSLDDIFDGAECTIPFLRLYDRSTGTFSQATLDAANATGSTSNMLIGERLEVLPRYRGQGVAKRIMLEGVRQFADVGLVAIFPYPLQFTNLAITPEYAAWHAAMKTGSFNPSREVGQEKLTKHYRSMGFASVPGTELMVFSC